MSCEIWQEKIDAFVDSELPPEQESGFNEHLRSCPACSQETLARQRLKVQTRLAGLRYSPVPAFERRMQKRLAAPTPRLPRLMLAGAVVAIILAVLAPLTWRTRAVRLEIVSELADQHVATLASDHPADVLSADSHTVKPWFAGKVPFSVDIPDLKDTGFELVGGRLVYLEQVPAAQLIFSIRKHRISVFMLRDREGAATLPDDAGPVRRSGFTTETWNEDGVRYFAISDVNPQDLHQLCARLKSAVGRFAALITQDQIVVTADYFGRKAAFGMCQSCAPGCTRPMLSSSGAREISSLHCGELATSLRTKKPGAHPDRSSDC